MIIQQKGKTTVSLVRELLKDKEPDSIWNCLIQKTIGSDPQNAILHIGVPDGSYCYVYCGAGKVLQLHSIFSIEIRDYLTTL